MFLLQLMIMTMFWFGDKQETTAGAAVEVVDCLVAYTPPMTHQLFR